MKTIVLTGGGTGGHVIPNLSLIPYLKKYFDKIVYIGTNSIEKEIIKKANIEFYEITATKFDRTNKIKSIFIPFKLLKSIIQAKKILKKIKPSVIFSKGGYVSVPVCIAGKLLKIPVVSHESDLSLGLANKIIYKFCTTFCTTFKQTSQNLPKAVFTGSPIRKELFFGNQQLAYSQTNLDNSKPTIMFLGGSTGSQKINDTVFSILDVLTKSYNVIHIVGKEKGKKNIKYPNYYQVEFCSNIQDLFSISDFVVSRAGSNAICELLALKKPMLLIPLANKASRGDQIDNANYFKEKGYALILEEQRLTSATLLQNIDLLNKKKNSLINQMNSSKFVNGTENIIKEIIKFI